ncbi:MAG: N-acetylmuramoyl-L-alanine amidase family protein [Anaerolineales bacterium]
MFNANNSSKPINQLLMQIPIILIVAGLLATLFTAWTEPGVSPNPLYNDYQIIAPDATAMVANPVATETIIPVGIVAGHYGNDSGSVCADGLKEVDVNLAIATLVQKQLAEKGIKSEILREFDPKLTNYHANLLLSIHADSCNFINNEATGFKVAAALSNPHPEKSARLVLCLRKNYAKTTGLTLHNSVTSDMQDYHAFNEINPDTVAAIIEVGFLNLDRQILTQKQDLVAQGITNGILCYLNNENISQ